MRVISTKRVMSTLRRCPSSLSIWLHESSPIANARLILRLCTSPMLGEWPLNSLCEKWSAFATWALCAVRLPAHTLALARRSARHLRTASPSKADDALDDRVRRACVVRLYAVTSPRATAASDRRMRRVDAVRLLISAARPCAARPPEAAGGLCHRARRVCAVYV
eukprot:scaffold25405_cov33-Tisochrysis_lutea.AAC.2